MHTLETISVADLMLDGKNPRHPSTATQRETIHAIVEHEPDKLVTLGKDIVASGSLSPIELPLVLKSGATHTVLEGNRRVAVLKLLLNPDLAPTAALQRRFRELAEDVAISDEVVCAVVKTRDEGRHWMELRHSGERGGAGVVPWNTEASARFAGRRGSQADKALAVIDAVESAFPKNQSLLDDIAFVRRNKLTTFGRLVSDPTFRDRLGIELSDSAVNIRYTKKSIEKAFTRIFSDLAGDLTVSDLSSKPQRVKYIGQIDKDLPDQKTFRASPAKLTANPEPANRTIKKASKKPSVGPEPLFADVELANLGGRVAAILAELKKMDVDRYPNACGALVRVLLELAVGQVYESKNWTEAGSLKDGVKKCLSQIDPNSKDQRFQPVRAGLQDGTSVLAVKTIQAYLHNPHYHPTPTELRTQSANYTPFLSALDTIV